MMIAAAAAALPLSAQDTSVPAGECCLPLLRPVGARALALGNAAVARGGADQLFVNPAALAVLRADELIVHSSKTAVDDTNVLSVLLATSAGTFGVTFQLVDFGTQEQTTGAGGAVGTIRVVEQGLKASYATPIALGFSAGVSYVLHQFRQDCEGVCNTQNFSGTTHLIDAGAQFRPPTIPGLELGASLMHVGFPLQVFNAEQAAPTPARVRIGAAYEVTQHFPVDSMFALHVMAAHTRPVRGDAPGAFGLGAELAISNTVFLRSGYSSGEGLSGGGSVGIGLRYNRFEVAVGQLFAATPLDDTQPFQISFSVRF